MSAKPPASAASRLSLEEAERALQEAEAFGIDLSLLWERLRLSPTERLERHAAALRFVHDLRDAVAAADAGR